VTKSRIFLFICLSFIGGIAVASFFSISLLALFAGFVLSLGSIAVFWRDKRVVVFGFCAILFFGGALRMHGEVKDNVVNSFGTRKQEVVLKGVVMEDPSPRRQSQQLVIKPEYLNGEKWSFGVQKVLVRTNMFEEYNYGDFIQAQGIISEPENFDQFDYKAFLRKGGIYWVMQNPHIEFLGAGTRNIMFEKLYAIKHRARELFQEHIASPQSEVIGALVFGEDKLLSKEFLEKLNSVGLRHIIAVSGMNITIIATMIMGMMLWAGFFRSHAFYLTIFFIILFVAMIGFPPSAVRAGIMGGLFLLAAHVGRLSSASRAIVAASAVMVAINPLLLRFDTGFQLSFAAMMGIIVFGEFFEKKLSRVPNWGLFPLRKTLGMTFAAQLGTAPVLLLYFDTFSFITPLTNILVVPLTSPLMMITIIFAIVVSFISFAAIPLGWILWLSASFIIFVTETFAKVPFGSVDLYGSLTRWTLFFMSIGGMWFVLRRMARERRMQKEYIFSKMNT
jgi:competence protein ComEC